MPTGESPGGAQARGKFIQRPLPLFGMPASAFAGAYPFAVAGLPCNARTDPHARPEAGSDDSKGVVSRRIRRRLPPIAGRRHIVIQRRPQGAVGIYPFRRGAPAMHG